MQRIEINVVTGDMKVLELTADEVADAQARTVAEADAAFKKANMPLDQKLARLGLTIADIKAAVSQ